MRLLTEEQRKQLVNMEYANDSIFNPIQDMNDNWVISEEEVSLCVNENFLWIKNLPIIKYIPKQQII